MSDEGCPFTQLPHIEPKVALDIGVEFLQVDLKRVSSFVGSFDVEIGPFVILHPARLHNAVLQCKGS